MSPHAGPDIVVVGGGIVGASIAWHLAPHANVTVIAEDVGGVATPNSFAWINAVSGDPQYYYDFRHRSLERWKQIGKELPHLPLHWGGGLNWSMDPDELQEYLEKYVGWGSDIVRVENTTINKLEPYFSGNVIPEWGLYSAEEGAIEAHIAARQLIANAETKGAKLFETTATGFLKTDGRISGVATAAGDVQADHVVVAAGIGSVALLATEDVTLPVTSKEGILVNSKPIRKRIVNSVSYTKELHIRQTLDGRIRAGSEAEADTPEEIAEIVFAAVKDTLKPKEKLELDYFTVGHRPMPEDGLPILGPTGLNGVTVAVMHSGVTNAAIVGELLSKQILTGESDPALDDFLLDRFE